MQNAIAIYAQHTKILQYQQYKQYTIYNLCYKYQILSNIKHYAIHSQQISDCENKYKLKLGHLIIPTSVSSRIHYILN